MRQKGWNFVVGESFSVC